MLWRQACMNEAAHLTSVVASGMTSTSGRAGIFEITGNHAVATGLYE